MAGQRPAPDGKNLGRIVLIGVFLWIFVIFCFLILAIFIDWQ
jgi:hypothetical protein